jgi:hypothetical protein
MTNGLSADNECISGMAGVVLRGPGWAIELTSGEACCLAREIESKWPDLAKELVEAAGSVDRFTGFDGPLGIPCDEIEARPGNYERAKELIAAHAPGSARSAP